MAVIDLAAVCSYPHCTSAIRLRLASSYLAR